MEPANGPITRMPNASDLRRPVLSEMDSPRHHLIISGTGRTGTTFLVQLLTALGLDTGFSSPLLKINPDSRAGLEWDIQREDAPYVVKNPALCERLEEILETGKIVVDFAIVPIRSLHASAESRRTVARASKKRRTPGGLWLTKSPARQEAVLAQQLHQLVYALVKHDVPLIWLHFPRLVQDPQYLFSKLGPILPGKDWESFLQAFRAVSRPELVHNFESSPGNALMSRWRRWFRPNR
jgi:hypothetical protein